MDYLDYEFCKKRLCKMQEIFGQILMEQEELFNITQLNAICYSEKIDNNSKSSLFDYYLSQKEKKQIDERLAEAKKILEERFYLLKIKENELRKSKNLFDLIYIYKFVDGLRIDVIAKKLNYSKSQIYRKIEKIEKMRHNAKKNMLN